MLLGHTQKMYRWGRGRGGCCSCRFYHLKGVMLPNDDSDDSDDDSDGDHDHDHMLHVDHLGDAMLDDGDDDYNINTAAMDSPNAKANKAKAKTKTKANHEASLRRRKQKEERRARRRKRREQRRKKGCAGCCVHSLLVANRVFFVIEW